jgi:integrase
MATVKKRGNKFIVISSEHDPESPGKYRQGWESFDSEDEAIVRKTQIDLEKAKMKLCDRAIGVTVRELLSDFIEIYGISKWALGTYSGNKAIIENYINPLIGDTDLSAVNGLFVDKFFRDLSKTKYVNTAQKTRNKGKTLAPSMLNSVYKLMSCAFNQAIRWEIITSNPFSNATLPDYYPAETKIWRSSEISSALAACDDLRLEVAINLAFACSMRAGEITGLQWRNVNVSEASIAEDDSWLYIDRELNRVDTAALIALDNKDVLFRFPKILPGKKTELVLKTPKTRSSIRKVWIPKTVAELLLRYRQWQNSNIQALHDIGEDYLDYDLVLTEETGRP